MPRLKPRQELFCERYVECANSTAAAIAAGYSAVSARNIGYRLLRQEQIVDRIAELQKAIAEAQCKSVDTLLGKLEMVYRQAVNDHQFSAAARAIELQAKLSGTSPERRRATTSKATQKRTLDQEIDED